MRRHAASKRSVFSCKPEKLFGDENDSEKMFHLPSAKAGGLQLTRTLLPICSVIS